jgi:hypothetical protein
MRPVGFALAEMVSHLRNALRQVAYLPDSSEKKLRRELALQRSRLGAR